jgi:hypothetical protein
VEQDLDYTEPEPALGRFAEPTHAVAGSGDDFDARFKRVMLNYIRKHGDIEDHQASVLMLGELNEQEGKQARSVDPVVPKPPPPVPVGAHDADSPDGKPAEDDQAPFKTGGETGRSSNTSAGQEGTLKSYDDSDEGIKLRDAGEASGGEKGPGNQEDQED